jgi:zinc protease
MKNYRSILLGLSFFLYSTLAFAVQPSGFNLPEYQKFKLKNGLTVFLMEQHEVPLINISGKFMAGAIKDGNKNGLASMTADALMFGTKTMTKEQIEAELDFVGAELYTYAGSEFASIYSSFAKKDQDKILNIISDVLSNPVFIEEEFEKAKKRKLVSLAQNKEVPRAVIGNYFNKFIYGSHPYANPVSGTVKGIESIAIEDIASFYNSNYNTSNSSIAIVGDFDSEEMKSKIMKIFGSWKTEKPEKNKLSVPSLDFPESQVLFVNKPDARITTYMIGSKGVARNNKDLVGINVINTILGGRFTSWLNNELRVNHGLTYGASSRFNTKLKGGIFTISTFTANATTIEALDRTLNMVDSLHTYGINEKTLESAKNYVKGGFPTRYETSGSLAQLLTDMFVYDFDESYINEFSKTVDELDTKKAAELVKKYFPKDKLQFVMIGKSEEFKDLLGKYGKIKIKELADEGF